jgi:hypothetical protein
MGQQQRDGRNSPGKKAGNPRREKRLADTPVSAWAETKNPTAGIEKRSVTIKDLSKLFLNKCG